MGDTSVDDYLKKLVGNLPVLPGVYQMKDQGGQVLYVGKAKNLRARVRSYFQQDSQHSAKTKFLVSLIADIDTIVTASELDALVLENTLIKKLKPKYNIRLRDDKTYPYIKIDWNKQFPRLEFTRKLIPGKLVRYFGPFVNRSTGELIRTISQSLKIRDCNDNKFANRSRPCLSYQMGHCTAPCVGLVTPEQYGQQVQEASEMLSGNFRELQTKLENLMNQAAENLEFERAAFLRDQWQSLQSLTVDQHVVRLAGRKDRDIIGLFANADLLSFSVLVLREGVVQDKRSYIVEQTGQEIAEQLDAFIMQYYAKNEPPNQILTPMAPASSAEDLAGALSLVTKRPVQLDIHVPSPRGDLIHLAEMANQNAQIDLKEHERKLASRMDDLAHLQKELSLNRKPTRIECFDISTFQGAQTVASRVVFVDGKPSKDDYRRYIIKTVQGIDDFSSMREVIERRFVNTQDPIPDLVVVDGGKGQLAMALQILSQLAITGIPVVGLAKSRVEGRFTEGSVRRSSERVFLPRQVNPVLLKEGTGSHRIMTQIRDEAHRFAITFHRQRREKISES